VGLARESAAIVSLKAYRDDPRSPLSKPPSQHEGGALTCLVAATRKWWHKVAGEPEHYPCGASSMINRRILLAAAIAGASLGAVAPGQAQSYPDHPVKLILPFTPGSPNGVLARLVLPYLSEHLGQPVVLDPRPGGGTTIGTKAMMAAGPDGYTLLFSNTPTLLIVPVASKAGNWDPLKDLIPLGVAATSSNVMVIAPSVPAKTVQEFVAYAKANPGKLNFGYGQGTQPQLIGEMFKLAADIDLANIPYKGGAQAVTDMLGGRIQLNVGTMSTLRPLHLSGKVRAIAVTSTERSPLLPDVPTMAESGYPSVTSLTYYGIFGAPGLPKDVVAKVNAALGEAAKSPELRAAMEKLGFSPHPLSPQDFAALMAQEDKKWVPIVKKTGFKM
jgi:tripartite-type tricarboxylate transporter receptor subunit TctC